jgi:lipoprotein Spr
MKAAFRYLMPVLAAAVMLGACKSQKSTRKPATSSARSSSSSSAGKEYRKLSEKLNLEVGQKDNVKLYEFVAEWLGVPHKDGGCDKRGTDCSCFVRMVYDHTYSKTLPRSSSEMYKLTSRLSKHELKEGDLVFFQIRSTKVSHVGIYLKDRWFAHVSSTKGVMINSLDEAYYQKCYVGAGR